MSRMTRNLQTGLAGVENVICFVIGINLTTGLTMDPSIMQVYTQHVPLLINTIDSALKGKLREASFPSVGSGGTTVAPKAVVVFVVGGVTYEEATKVHEINKSGVKVILGGTCIHNSSSFLAELRAL